MEYLKSNFSFSQVYTSSLFKLIQDNYEPICLFFSTFVIATVFLQWLTRKRETKHEEKKDPIVLQNFTLSTLSAYKGETEDTPIYLAAKGDVYDVSSARNFYGPDGVYGCFAGRDCTRALAKQSTDIADLINPQTDDLTYSEKDNLDDWIQKYKYYKQYPIVGKLVYLESNEELIKKNIYTMETLKQFDGESNETPDGYAVPPLLIAIKGKVYDMSFGGGHFYGKGGPYGVLAGRDASRALACMQKDEEYVNNPDISVCTEKEIKTLNDWERKLSSKYPCVGILKTT